MTKILVRGEEIATLTLAGTTPLNLLTFDALQELEEVLEKLAAKPRLKVLVVTGHGDRAFCAGADLHQLVELMADRNRVRAFVEVGGRALERLEQFPLPVIAAINGHALGAGFELAMACDLRLIKASAKMGQPASALGLVPPFGGTTRLPRLVGEARAKEIWFTSAILTAAQAQAHGLVNQVVSDEDFAPAVVELADCLARTPRRALLGTKQVWMESITRGREAALATEAETLYTSLIHPRSRELLRRHLGIAKGGG